MTISKEDYIKLLESIVKEQYGDNSEDEDIEFVPFTEEIEIKERFQPPNPNTFIDLTNLKKDRIIPSIMKFSNLRICKFLIKITDYNTGEILNTGTPKWVSFTLYEEQLKKHIGNVNNMWVQIRPQEDDRFENRPWLSYFYKNSWTAKDMPLETVMDVVRWIRAIDKMKAFL